MGLVLYIGLGARQLAEIQDAVITRLALGGIEGPLSD